MERSKGWYIKQSYSSDFIDTLQSIYDKYGEDIFEIQGIANRHMDLVQFSKSFFGKSSNVADVTVDANANVKEKNITQYNFENNKALMRLNSLYMVYKMIKENYNESSAKEALEKIINGELFVNDLHSFSSQPYCYAFDLRNLLNYGMNFFKGNMNIKPPKRSESFLALLIQTTAYISNQIVGACCHGNQNLLFNINNRNIAMPIQKFVEQFKLDKSFEQDGMWEYANIPNGYQVWENNKFVSISKVYRKKYNGKIYNITTASGKKTSCSKDHKFKILFRGREIEERAENLKLYDTVINTVCYSNLPININSQDYMDGQFIGILSGDGCLSREEGVNVSINNKERFIGEWLKKYSLKKYNKETYITEDNCWLLHSKEIRKNILNEYFLSENQTYKCDDKYIDTTKYSLDFLVGFIDGLFTTDGSWNSCHILALTNKHLINNIITILDLLGINHSDVSSYQDIRLNRKLIYRISIGNEINKYLDLTNKRRNNNKKYVGSIQVQTAYIGKYYSETKTGEHSSFYKKGFVPNRNGNKKIIPKENTDAIVSINIVDNDMPYVYEIETETGWYSAGHILTHNCSYPDFFVCLDKFYRQEFGENYIKTLTQENWKKIKNQFQNLIYSLNFPFRGSQSSFTNLSVMDRGFMKNLFQGYVFPDFTMPDIESTIGLSKKFFEYFTDINSVEGVFTFPVITLAISLDDNNQYIDPDFVDWAAAINCKKALANIFQSKPTSFSSCCRLRSDYSKVADVGYQNSFGVAGLSIGSHRVAGLNLPRLALLEKNDPDILEKDLELLHKILYSHRQLLKDRISGGYLPLYTHNWIDLNRQYSTIGFVGGYEYIINKGLKIETKRGIKSLQTVLNKIEGAVIKWQANEQEEKNIYNIEQIPAESMAVRLADIDYLLGYNNNDKERKFQLYSNQYIPLTNDASIYDRLRIQGEFDSLTSGGAILHINVDDENPISKELFKRLMDIARQLKTTYFAINYAYSECEKNHITIGKNNVCPICQNKIIQQYTRVVGFITPVRAWNKTRREYEYDNRIFYHNGALDVNMPEEEKKAVQTEQQYEIAFAFTAAGR